MAQIKKVSVTAVMGNSLRVDSEIRGHKLCVDQPKAAGGTDLGPTPLEYLFLSLAGCIASIARIIAMQEKLPINGVYVTVSGPLDIDGLLGKDSEAKVGFQEITVDVKIDGEMDTADKQEFLKRVDARCPISDNLLNRTPVRVRLQS